MSVFFVIEMVLLVVTLLIAAVYLVVGGYVLIRYYPRERNLFLDICIYPIDAMLI
jgi:hypothetical protein